jgi:hypothetical protein
MIKQCNLTSILVELGIHTETKAKNLLNIKNDMRVALPTNTVSDFKVTLQSKPQKMPR